MCERICERLDFFLGNLIVKKKNYASGKTFARFRHDTFI